MTPDRKPIGSCAICFEQTGDLVLAYYRRNFDHPKTGKRMEGVQMCKRHSNKVTRYADPYFEPRRVPQDEREEAVRRYLAGGTTLRELGAEYGVDFSTVRKWVLAAKGARGKKRR